MSILILDDSVFEQLTKLNFKKFFRIEIKQTESESEFSIFPLIKKSEQEPSMTDAIIKKNDITILIDFITYQILSENIIRFDNASSSFMIDNK